MVHTFQSINNLSPSAYTYLHNNLPSLKKVSEYVERTNYYSAKGITQIELKVYRYKKQIELAKYYLELRYNLSVIMGDSKVFVIDSTKYTSTEIIQRIRKRLYEINEFRYIQLHKMPMFFFRTSRADIAEDVTTSINPVVIVWLCNMSFPYKYRNMKRKSIKKDIDVLYFESCCFASGSREINIYYKWIAMKNTGKEMIEQEEEKIKHTVRFEVQIKKKGIEYLATKLPTKKSMQKFFEHNFCHDYLSKELRSIFCIQRYVSRSMAETIIRSSSYNSYQKEVMISVIDMIQHFKGLYELEKAIDDKNIYTPPQYGNLRSFRECWLKKIRSLGIQPVVIPDHFGIDEIPSMNELLGESEELK